jgi:hypothetical protein
VGSDTLAKLNAGGTQQRQRFDCSTTCLQRVGQLRKYDCRWNGVRQRVKRQRRNCGHLSRRLWRFRHHTQTTLTQLTSPSLTRSVGLQQSTRRSLLLWFTLRLFDQLSRCVRRRLLLSRLDRGELELGREAFECFLSAFAVAANKCFSLRVSFVILAEI